MGFPVGWSVAGPSTIISGLPRDSVPPNRPSVPIANGLAWAGTLLPAIGLVHGTGSDADEGMAPVLFAGIALGPSLGQFYARSPIQGLIGAGLRAGGGALFIHGLREAFKGFGCGGSTFGGEEEECEEGDAAGQLAFIAGGVMLLGGTLYSIVDAGPAVHRWSRRNRKAWAMEFAPALRPTPGAAWETGLRASLRF